MSEQIKKEDTPATDTSANDNKAVFGPLGKYAVVAVIMVSIIVTTAIMLDRELNTAEQQVATMESEVAEINATAKADSTDVKEVAVTEDVATEAPAETHIASANPVAEEPVAAKSATKKPAVEKVVAIKEEAIKENNTVATTEKAAPAPEQAVTAKPEVAKIEVAKADTRVEKPVKASQSQMTRQERDQERQARIDAFKLEQKQHMSEMFARIKTLESQQLDQYKEHQDDQIKRLREQIAQQQQVIEALILRNKERLDLRAASIQRKQTHREEMLNRI